MNDSILCVYGGRSALRAQVHCCATENVYMFPFFVRHYRTYSIHLQEKCLGFGFRLEAWETEIARIRHRFCCTPCDVLICLYFWSQRNLRIQLTDAATEVAEIPQMFEYMEQTWFPFLWHSPNAAGRADFKSFSWFCRRAALSLSDFFSYHLNMGVTVAGMETSLLPSRQMTLLGGSLRLVNIDP